MRTFAKFPARLAAAVAVLGLGVMSVQAQERGVSTAKERSDTVKISLSGDVVLDYVYRGPEITFFTDGFTGGVGSDGEDTFEGYISTRLDAQMSGSVKAVVEIGTERVDAGAGGINTFGGAGAQDIVLREAHISVGEFLQPELQAQIGISTWSFDVRGKGSAFAMDPRHSQSFGRNGSVTEDTGALFTARGGVPEELDPVGVGLQYGRGAVTMDVVLLPAVIEGGNPGADEALYAVDLWYNLDQVVTKGSRVGGIVAISTLPGTDTSIYTIGAGGVLNNVGSEGLELYAELYVQSGKAGQDATGDSIDAAGRAFQLGGEYHIQKEMSPWIGLNYTMVSGDDDTTATDDKADGFLSYENINDLLILEDMYFGLDIDSNYTALKISGGLALSVGSGKDNVVLTGIIGMAKASEDINFGALGNEDKLGNEVDIRAKWILGKQAAINAAVAMLTGSDVVENAMGGSANSDAEDSTNLYTVGVDLKF